MASSGEYKRRIAASFTRMTVYADIVIVEIVSIHGAFQIEVKTASVFTSHDHDRSFRPNWRLFYITRQFPRSVLFLTSHGNFK